MTATVEDWARDYVLATRLEHKFDPPPVPTDWSASPQPERIAGPGRPAGLEVVAKSPRSLRPVEMRDPHKRARMLHAMAHHELQAAELFAWAILAFADAPQDFRAGLLRLCQDEIRHARAYVACIEALGSRFGEFPVRDWFWQRVSQCDSALRFVAMVGLGLEGGNLDHAARCARDFEAVGDTRAAKVHRMVEREEIAHVRFAVDWFRRFTGGLDFDRWCAELVTPLTPTMMRGKALNRAARAEAGMDEAFLERLAAYGERDD